MAQIQVSSAAIDELHAYFNSVKDRIPKTVMLTAAETVNNVPWLIDECFVILSDDSISARIRGMRVDMLKRIKAAIEPIVGA